MTRDDYVERYAQHFFRAFSGDMSLGECRAAAEEGALAREYAKEPLEDPEEDAAEELSCWEDDGDG